MTTRRKMLWLGTIGAALALAGGGAWRSFAREMARARARIATGSAVVDGPFGATEYAVAGEGPPVVMIHGTGGGFDQGLAFAAPLIAAGRRVVAPSRFGYLRTAFPAEASSERQADAIAALMDTLRIARAPVIGGSAGALAALHFALRHPARCSALVALVPATHAPDRPPPRPSAFGQAIMDRALGSDFLFWAGAAAAEDTMIRVLLATDPALVRAAAPAEQARVRAILSGILPVSARAAGLRNDARLAGTPAPMPLERIAAPTLAISLADDRFETLASARHIAATVPGARLVAYPTGGHVWVGRERELFGEIAAFLAGR